MRTSRKGVIGATLVAFALVAAACGSGDDASEPKEGPTIAVGSFSFGESVILAQIYAQALETNGYPVDLSKLEAGSREIVKPAIESGEIDLVPEYVGSALEGGFGGEPTADSDATAAALREAFAAVGVAVLEPAPAQDKNGIVVTKALADELGLSKTSDLADHAADLVFGGPPECPTRPRCLIGLGDTYGLVFSEFKALDTGGPLTVAALEGGEIDVALLFTTDGVIADKGFVLLEDDGGLQPAENIIPVIRQEMLDAYGDDLTSLLNDVSAKITTEELTEMNRRFGVDLVDAEEVAKDWLDANGFGA
ncbi:MAG: ABC transporter substrate-binding protein [Acidimicrobiia bacterium]|nr:ABC transporter substrate-binding protein [Acidimicrobiia bacterium]